MPDAPSSLIYQLTISLRGISPMIWRRLLVPADLTLHDLHRTIQAAGRLVSCGVQRSRRQFLPH